MSQQLWGPALDAELEYRREIAAKSYGRPAGTSWTARVWRRSRAWATRNHEGNTIPGTTGVHADAETWEGQHWDDAQLQEALEALRPREGVGRRAA